LPTGAFGARTFATSSKVATSTDQFSIRIDQHISDKTVLMGRFSLNQVNGPTTNPDQTAIDPSFGVKFFDHQRNATVRLAHTFSPQLSSTSSFGYIRSTPFSRLPITHSRRWLLTTDFTRISIIRMDRSSDRLEICTR
jgi:hypothetical protein